MTANRIEIVSERFRWHSDTSEIEDARDNTRRKIRITQRSSMCTRIACAVGS